MLNSVLHSLPLYYFSLYKTPLTVIENFEKIRRQFLWSGKWDCKKICWVSWNKVLAPKSRGRLGVSCLRIMILSLRVKWWWRLKTNLDALWCSVVSFIHKWERHDSSKMTRSSYSRNSKEITKIKVDFKSFNTDLHALFTRRIENGSKCYFWLDKCRCNQPFKV